MPIESLRGMAKQKMKVKDLRQIVFRKCLVQNIFEVGKVGCKNSVILYHKDYDSINVNPDHSESNQLITAY